MHWPITYVTTKDKLRLYGLFLEPKNPKAILINIHGTQSNLYENDYLGNYADVLGKRGISILSTNNRGTAILANFPQTGAATEHFEDCVKDIDAWMEFAIKKGHKKIILEGHSLGTEKVVYYMNKGKYRSKVNAVILLGFSDSWGYERYKWLKDRYAKVLREARRLVKQGKGYELIRSVWLVHGGGLPKTAHSFINTFGPKSKSKATLPFRTGALPMIKSIKVPILGVTGDEYEFTVIPLKKAMQLIESENPLAKCYKIKNSNHDFEGKEKELTRIVERFISRAI